MSKEELLLLRDRYWLLCFASCTFQLQLSAVELILRWFATVKNGTNQAGSDLGLIKLTDYLSCVVNSERQ